MKSAGVSVVELTWYLDPGTLSSRPDGILDAIARYAPTAAPVRFGPGDPPRFSIKRDGFERLSSEWAKLVDREYAGLFAWRPARPYLAGSFMFPDRRQPDTDPRPPIASMQWLVEARYVLAAPAEVTSSFAGVAQDLGAFYGCGYLLDGWWVSGQAVGINSNTSTTSPLPGGTRWLGIPPGAPWLEWFGPPYAEILAGKIDAAAAIGVGLVARRDALIGTNDGHDPWVDLERGIPQELMARRRDPAMLGVPPSVSAAVIPRLT